MNLQERLREHSSMLGDCVFGRDFAEASDVLTTASSKITAQKAELDRLQARVAELEAALQNAQKGEPNAD